MKIRLTLIALANESYSEWLIPATVINPLVQTIQASLRLSPGEQVIVLAESYWTLLMGSSD